MDLRADSFLAGSPDSAAMILDNLLHIYRLQSSAIKGVGDSIYNAVEKAVDGTLPYGEYQILGIEDGVVGLADNDIYQSVVSDDAKKAVEDAKEKLLAGEVTVDSAYGMDEATLKGIINGAQ